VRRSRDIHKLLSYCAVLDVSDVKDVGLLFLFSLLILLLSSSFRAEPGEPASRLLVVEEAHLYFGGQLDQRTKDVKESTPSGAMRIIRKAGFSVLLCNQLLGGMAKPVLGNLGSVICLQLTRGECIREAASLLGLRKWQEDELRALRAREAIVRFSRHPEPIHVAISEVPPEVVGVRVSRAKAAEMSRPLLDQIPYERRPETESGADLSLEAQMLEERQATSKPRPVCRACAEMGLSLSRTDHKVMEAICEAPCELVPERCDRTGLRRETESASRRKLMPSLIRYVGSVGNRRGLFDLGEAGTRWAKAHGLRVSRRHGSLTHELCTRKAEKKIA